LPRSERPRQRPDGSTSTAFNRLGSRAWHFFTSGCVSSEVPPQVASAASTCAVLRATSSEKCGVHSTTSAIASVPAGTSKTKERTVFASAAVSVPVTSSSVVDMHAA
jgi:hypothetical protein